jgi:hypothetical protein
MNNTTTSNTNEVPISIALTMQGAILGRLKSNWTLRNTPITGVYFRESIRECVTAVRFMRQHQLTATKHFWIK